MEVTAELSKRSVKQLLNCSQVVSLRDSWYQSWCITLLNIPAGVPLLQNVSLDFIVHWLLNSNSKAFIKVKVDQFKISMISVLLYANTI